MKFPKTVLGRVLLMLALSFVSLIVTVITIRLVENIVVQSWVGFVGLQAVMALAISSLQAEKATIRSRVGLIGMTMVLSNIFPLHIMGLPPGFPHTNLIFGIWIAELVIGSVLFLFVIFTEKKEDHFTA